MILLCRNFVALGLSAVIGMTVKAVELKLPPVDGELAGDFTPLILTGAPKLHWSLATRRAVDHTRRATLAIDGPGARLRAEVDFRNESGGGEWKLDECTLDAAAWFGVLAPQLGLSDPAMAATGNFVLSGGGELKAGQLRGTVKLEWRDGALRNAAQGWGLEGISLAGEFAIDTERGSFASARPLGLTVRTVNTPRFGARNIFIQARLGDDRVLAVSAARVEVAGGEVTLEPCAVPLSPPAFDLNLRIDRVGLQDIAALVPSGLSDARGRIDGAVHVSWSDAGGFQLGAGSLVLRDDEPAIVRLASTPGFLTDHVPQRIALLPDWTGGIGRHFSPLNPAYADLQQIELGRADLRVETLKVELTPEGDDRGRSAHVEATARPAEANGTIKEVTFEINVAGPLGAVLRLGLNQNFSMGLR